MVNSSTTIPKLQLPLPPCWTPILKSETLQGYFFPWPLITISNKSRAGKALRRHWRQLCWVRPFVVVLGFKPHCRFLLSLPSSLVVEGCSSQLLCGNTATLRFPRLVCILYWPDPLSIVTAYSLFDAYPSISRLVVRKDWGPASWEKRGNQTPTEISPLAVWVSGSFPTHPDGTPQNNPRSIANSFRAK